MNDLWNVVLLDGEKPVMLMSNLGIMFMLLMGCGVIAFSLIVKIIFNDTI